MGRLRRHARQPAGLEEFVRLTRGTADAYLCLGDTVNYGPWNDECLDLIGALPGVVTLEGNHERLFRGDDDIAQEPDLVRAFYRCSVRSFTRRDALEGLAASYELGTFACVHTIGSLRIYRDTALTVDRNYFVGHTHYQFEVERGGHRVVNPGSVGQNRKDIRFVNYALYDPEADQVRLCQAPYRWELFVNELVARAYPQRCVDYYLGKLR